MKPLLTLIVSSVLLFSCCPKKDCIKRYTFEFPLETTLKDSFNLGDTIWYEMNISNKLLDKNTGEFIDMTDFELSFDFSFTKLDTTDTNEVTHLFSYYADSGSVAQGSNNSLNIFFQSVQEKNFRIGFIPLEKGTYFSSIHLAQSILSVDWEFYNKELCTYSHPGLQITNTTCKETILNDTRMIINQDSVNYHLVNGICQMYNNGETYCYPAYNKFKKAAFAFVVN